MVPLSDSNVSGTFRAFDVRMALCATPPQHGVRRVAMQHVRRPKALNLTEIDSQKSEHDTICGISVVERDLRPI